MMRGLNLRTWCSFKDFDRKIKEKDGSRSVIDLPMFCNVKSSSGSLLKTFGFPGPGFRQAWAQHASSIKINDKGQGAKSPVHTLFNALI